jgi:NAD(P)-dependent dehydrogenase (short-subunit alcohol dehydrogenase family)
MILQNLMVQKKSKIIAISGANTGIGFATAKLLLDNNATILMFCRDIQKAEIAKVELEKITKNHKIEIFEVNFESFTSIENACKKCLIKYPIIDVLINNAGIMSSNFELTQSNIEKTIAVNHFGYFLMAFYLLPALKNAKKSRIINVASRAHYGVKFDVNTINLKEKFSFRNQYKLSKLANVMFTIKLSKVLKQSNITVNCLDPGLVKTEIGSKLGSKFWSFIWRIFTFRAVDIYEGAKTSVFLALSDEVQEISGEYFENCNIYPISEEAKNEISIDEFWTWSEKIAQINFQ